MLGCALRRGLIGFAVGIAVDYVAAMITSFVLKLGYFMPCLASLPEQVGGEMNAVLLQAMTCGLAGTAVGIATAVLKMGKRKPAKRLVALVFMVIALVFPVGMLLVYIA